MKIISKVTFGLVILLILVGCHKEKKCIGNSFSPIPFWEIFADFGCNSNNLPYQYVFMESVDARFVDKFSLLFCQYSTTSR